MASEAQAIDGDLAERLAPSVGLRNVIIHEYERLDLGRLAASIPLALGDYREFVRQVARFAVSNAP